MPNMKKDKEKPNNMKRDKDPGLHGLHACPIVVEMVKRPLWSAHSAAA